MKKRFHPLNFLPRLAAVLVLGILILGFLWIFDSPFFRSKARDLARPSFNIAIFLSDFADGLKGFFTSKSRLNDRVSELENRNRELEVKNSLLESELTEFRRLNEFFSDARPKGKIAMVLSQSPNIPFDSILIDLGGDDGFQIGSTATAYGGILLGEVSELGKKSSLVRLISSPGLETEAWLERLSLNVTLEGRGGYNLKLSLPKSVDVQIGDRVFSNTNPPLLIGQIEKIYKEPSLPLQDILLRLPLNIANLRYVELLH